MGVIAYTESRPSDVLANLHASADAEREYLFAYQDAGNNDLILVAWYAGRAIGYLAASDERVGDSGDMLIWEHVVAPEFRQQGIGRRLLLEAAKRTDPSSRLCIDPMHELDEQRVADYYLKLGFEVGADDCVVATAAELIAGLGHRREDATTVAELLGDKAGAVVTVEPSTTVAEALHLLNERQIGAVVVSTDGKRIEGIISERGFLMGIDDHGADFLSQTVGECTTTDVMTVTTSDVLSDVMETMTDGRHRHLPVTEAGSLVGIVSVGDLVRFRLRELAHPELAQAVGD